MHNYLCAMLLLLFDQVPSSSVFQKVRLFVSGRRTSLTSSGQQCACHHSMTFLALVIALVWYKAAVGIPVACGSCPDSCMFGPAFRWTRTSRRVEMTSRACTCWRMVRRMRTRRFSLKGCEGEPMIAHFFDVMSAYIVRENQQSADDDQTLSSSQRTCCPLSVER
ncbi:hypothetical protein EDB19DRAFT_1715971 [Suillus lakei]|nr:hypothetical protein EDB19DRAFT_1715971 [Suillus lakei]